MKLIVITPEDTAANEPAIVNALFEQGLQRLHLRKPQYAPAGYRAYLDAVQPRYYRNIVVHGCFELVGAFGLGGIHLSGTLKDDAAARAHAARLSPHLSASFHSWQEVAGNNYPYQYLFISPVFDSISKPGYHAAIDLNGAKETRRRWMNPGPSPLLIGLGGACAAQLPVLHRHGFDGAALLGAIWTAQDPVQAFIEALAASRAVTNA